MQKGDPERKNEPHDGKSGKIVTNKTIGLMR